MQLDGSKQKPNPNNFFLESEATARCSSEIFTIESLSKYRYLYSFQKMKILSVGIVDFVKVVFVRWQFTFVMLKYFISSPFKHCLFWACGG